MKQTAQAEAFNLKVEFSREHDGRWLADIPALPGVTVYGQTRKRALAAAEALALRVVADRREHGETVPGHVTVSFAP
jgi:predicted RNase H-like HicB family nuclease